MPRAGLAHAIAYGEKAACIHVRAPCKVTFWSYDKNTFLELFLGRALLT